MERKWIVAMMTAGALLGFTMFTLLGPRIRESLTVGSTSTDDNPYTAFFGQTVAIKGPFDNYNRYCGVKSMSDPVVQCSDMDPSDNHLFNVEKTVDCQPRKDGLTECQFAMKNKLTGLYCADEGNRIICNRDMKKNKGKPGDWEKFAFIKQLGFREFSIPGPKSGGARKTCRDAYTGVVCDGAKDVFGKNDKFRWVLASEIAKPSPPDTATAVAPTSVQPSAATVPAPSVVPTATITTPSASVTVAPATSTPILTTITKTISQVTTTAPPATDTATTKSAATVTASTTLPSTQTVVSPSPTVPPATVTSTPVIVSPSPTVPPATVTSTPVIVSPSPTVPPATVTSTPTVISPSPTVPPATVTPTPTVISPSPTVPPATVTPTPTVISPSPTVPPATVTPTPTVISPSPTVPPATVPPSQTVIGPSPTQTQTPSSAASVAPSSYPTTNEVKQTTTSDAPSITTAMDAEEDVSKTPSTIQIQDNGKTVPAPESVRTMTENDVDATSKDTATPKENAAQGGEQSTDENAEDGSDQIVGWGTVAVALGIGGFLWFWMSKKNQGKVM